MPRAQISVVHLGRKAHSLMPTLVSRATLKRAARLCMRRKSAPGPDAITWRCYRQNLDANLLDLAERIRTDAWRPGPHRVCAIETFTGKSFSVAVSNVEDRIVHRAMRLTLEPFLEAFAFRDFVSGFRPRRNRLTTVRQAREQLASFPWVLDVDVSGLSSFDDTDYIISLIARYVSDGQFLSRIRRVLDGFDTPLQPGSGLAPLLMNLLLVPIDEGAIGLNIVRFGDNYCVFCRSEAEATEALTRMERLLQSVGLSMSKRKTSTRFNPNAEDLFLLGE